MSQYLAEKAENLEYIKNSYESVGTEKLGSLRQRGLLTVQF